MKLPVSSLATIGLFLSASIACAAIRDVEPGSDLSAIARAALSGDVIRLKAGRYQGAFLAERKRLTIQGPASGEAIVEPGRSNFVLGAVDGGALEISNVSIETSANANLGLYAKGATLRCTGCQIRGKAGRAVYADSGTLDLVSVSLSVPNGEALVAVNGSTLRMKGTAIRSDAGRPFVADNAVMVEIEDSSFVGREGAFVRGAKNRVTVTKSTFDASSADTVGMEIEGGGSISINQATMTGGRLGFVAQLQPGSALKAAGLVAVGGRGGVHIEQKADGQASQISFADGLSVAHASSSDAIALRGVGRVEINTSGHVAVSAGPAGVIAGSNAVVSLGRGIASGTRQAVASADKPGDVRTIEAVLLPATIATTPGVTLDGGSLRIDAVLRKDKGLSADFQTAVAAAIRARNAGGLHELAEKARAGAADYSILGFQLSDAVGKAVIRPFVVLDLDGKKVAESRDGRQVPLEAGAYLVEELGGGASSTDIDVGKGESLTAKVEVPDALWLNSSIEKDKPEHLVLFRPVEQDVARRVFTSIGGGYSFAARIWRRPEASAEEVQRGLEAARKLAALRLTFPPNGSAAEKNRYNVWSAALTDWALPVLASFGGPADGLLIARAFERSDMPEQNRGPVLPYLAYLEWRLGLLGKGEIARLAQNGPLAANALVLQSFYDLPGANQRLVALMQDAQRFAALTPFMRDEVASQIAARDIPSFGAAASAVLQRILARPAAQRLEVLRELSMPAAAYLLLFGSAEEKRALADEIGKPAYDRTNILAWLTRLAANPAEIGGEIIRSPQVGGDIIAFACSFLRLRGDASFDEALDRVIVAFANHAVALNEKNYQAHPSQIYNNSVLTRHLLLGACRPDVDIGRIYYRDMADAARQGSPGNWYPGFRTAEKAGAFMEKGSYLSDELKSSAPALVTEAWNKTKAAGWSDFRDERIALFRTFSKVGDTRSNAATDDGVERRVFVLGAPTTGNQYSGSFAGHAEVRPRVIDGRIAIDVRLNHRVYYWGIEEAGLATAIATGGDLGRWAHHSYVAAAGRKLIERFTLVKGSQPVDVDEQAPSADGTIRLVTRLPASDWSELALTIDLALFEDRRSLGFDLFANGLARGKSTVVP